MGAPPQPLQVPGFDIPGAEYFSLAPGAHIAFGGRRRFLQRPAAISAPASTNGVNLNFNIPLETTFTQTSAIYLHYFFLLMLPLGGGLTISNVLAGLSFATSPFGGDYPLGIPVFTTPLAEISIPVLTDRDKLISAKDIQNVGQGPQSPGNLSLAATISVNNTTAAAISFTGAAVIIYTRLDGLTE